LMNVIRVRLANRLALQVSLPTSQMWRDPKSTQTDMVNTNSHLTTLRCVCSVSFSLTVTSCGLTVSPLLAVWERFWRPCRPRRSFGTEQDIALRYHHSWIQLSLLMHVMQSYTPASWLLHVCPSHIVLNSYTVFVDLMHRRF